MDKITVSENKTVVKKNIDKTKIHTVEPVVEHVIKPVVKCTKIVKDTVEPVVKCTKIVKNIVKPVVKNTVEPVVIQAV